jgi:hypothetical protein
MVANASQRDMRDIDCAQLGGRKKGKIHPPNGALANNTGIGKTVLTKSPTFQATNIPLRKIWHRDRFRVEFGG